MAPFSPCKKTKHLLATCSGVTAVPDLFAVFTIPLKPLTSVCVWLSTILLDTFRLKLYSIFVHKGGGFDDPNNLHSSPRKFSFPDG